MTGNANGPTRTELIERKIDYDTAGQIALQQRGSGFVPVFRSMDQLMEFAKMMAISGTGVRKHLRERPGTCLSIVMQAQKWGFDPYVVANKSYEVNDQIAYEAQLITAVVNTRAPIVGRLKTRFVGEGAARKCIASATFRGDVEPTEVESPPIGQITPKNSPLWKSDPDQQLAYYTKRLWARREVPELLLGAYDIDEFNDHGEVIDVTPSARPRRADYGTAGPTTTDGGTFPDQGFGSGASEAGRNGELRQQDQQQDDETKQEDGGSLPESFGYVPVPLIKDATGRPAEDWPAWDRALIATAGTMQSLADMQVFRDRNRRNLERRFQMDPTIAGELVGRINEIEGALS